MFSGYMSEASVLQITTIANRLMLHPLYSKYTIQSYCFDWSCDVYAIKISENFNTINLFLFYPSTTGDGTIESIAIYGMGLSGHLEKILASKRIFGLEIESAEIDRSGMSDFVDVYLK